MVILVRCHINGGIFSQQDTKVSLRGGCICGDFNDGI